MTDQPMSPVPSLPSGPSPIAMPLQRTQPWVRFLAIMGFLAAGFMVLAGLIAGAAGVATANYQTMALMVFYPIIGVLYVFPSVYLLRYADRIKEFVSSSDERHLVSALDAQRSFWKFAGVYTLICLVVGGLVMIGAVVIGILFGINATNFGQ